MTLRFKALFVVILSSLVLSACGTLQVGLETQAAPPAGGPTASPTLPPADTPTAAPTHTAAPTPVPTLANVETYTNTEFGFEVDYPEGWVADTTGIGHGVILWSRKPGGPGRDGVPSDVTKIDIIGLPGMTLTLDELVAQQKDSLANSNGTVLAEERLVLPSGLEAVRMHVEGFDEALTLMAIVNGHPIIMAAFGDLSRFDAVAQTLRPIGG